jgi:hypothetical protein
MAWIWWSIGAIIEEPSFYPWMSGRRNLEVLAGGHVGGEWSGRTLKNLLTQCGHRGRLLAAKLGSLWLAGVGLVGVCWAALAVAGPVLAKVDQLPDPHQSFASSSTLRRKSCCSAYARLRTAGRSSHRR